MNDREICQALLCAVAGTPCPVSFGTAAIHPARLVLLWDDRPEADWLMLDAVASEFGKVRCTATIERGPHGQPMTGAIVQPRTGELDATAIALRLRYGKATATTIAQPQPSHAPLRDLSDGLRGRVENGHGVCGRAGTVAMRSPAVAEQNAAAPPTRCCDRSENGKTVPS